MKNKKHPGLFIGTIFSLLSILLTFTLVVPMFSVLPGFFIQDFLSKVFPYLVYENNGMLVLIALLVIFSLAMHLALRRKNLWKDKVPKNRRIEIGIIMLVFYFIVHPLGFYLFWGFCLNFKSDAQIIFDSVFSFPISSLSFLLIGYCLDS